MSRVVFCVQQPDRRCQAPARLEDLRLGSSGGRAAWTLKPGSKDLIGPEDLPCALGLVVCTPVGSVVSFLSSSICQDLQSDLFGVSVCDLVQT